MRKSNYVYNISTLKDFDKLPLYSSGLTAVIIESSDIILASKNDTGRLLMRVFGSLHQCGAVIIKKCSIKSLRTLRGLLKDNDFQKIIAEKEESRQTIRITAFKRRLVHTQDPPLANYGFRKKLPILSNRTPGMTADVTYIITVRNEANNLPHFLSFFDKITDQTDMKREFIFVVNGSTDNSESILREYCRHTRHDAIVYHSPEIGILPAFRYGLTQKKYSGYVGRFDADIILNPFTLDLMQSFLSEMTDVKVTYAEPLTLERLTTYNEPWHDPSILSKRLYYVGKCSLYRDNPFDDEVINLRHKSIIADDVFTSFYFAYFFGLDSIMRTPNACVYEKPPGTFRDLILQLSRIDSEIVRIYNHYPIYRDLHNLMVQDVRSSRYKNLLRKAAKQTYYVDTWSRLSSTK